MANKFVKEYFDWICQLISDDEYFRRSSYQKLLKLLYDREFVFVLGIDGNRAEDGIDLRYRFGYERKYPGAEIAEYLDKRPCSILEMMAALAIRCEEQIMEDPDVGNRTGLWFWNMVINLGLDNMTDTRFDKEYVDKTIDCFLKRKYNRNGRGGLFTVHNNEYDMRSAEIWYQMCWYLDEILQN